jgi:hypothetical protein
MSIPSPVQDPLVSANLLVAFAHASAVPRFSHVSWALTRVECFTTSVFLLNASHCRVSHLKSVWLARAFNRSSRLPSVSQCAIGIRERLKVGSFPLSR